MPVGAEEGVDVKLAIGGRSCNVTALVADPLLGGEDVSDPETTRDQSPPGSETLGVYDPNQYFKPESKTPKKVSVTAGCPLRIRRLSTCPDPTGRVCPRE